MMDNIFAKMGAMQGSYGADLWSYDQGRDKQTKLRCKAKCKSEVDEFRGLYVSKDTAPLTKTRVYAVGELFGAQKSSCLICQSLVRVLMITATKNGDGAMMPENYCKDDVYDIITRKGENGANIDTFYDTQIMTSLSRSRDYDAQTPADLNYVTDYCLGMSRELSLFLSKWNHDMGGLPSDSGQASPRPLFTEIIKSMALAEIHPHSKDQPLSPTTFAKHLCGSYLGCERESAQNSAVHDYIATVNATIGIMKGELAKREQKMIATKKALRDSRTRKELKTLMRGNAAELQANIEALKLAIASQTSHLRNQDKRVSAEMEEDKDIMGTCFFQCFEPTKFWRNLYNDRGVYGRDPLPMSSMVAGRSTRRCGFPVRVKRAKECQKCTSLKCLTKARMSCYQWKCTSPYVQVAGETYYVPKLVVIGKVGD